MSAAAIETRRLGKRYARVTALDDLSLRVEPGEVFGFLGPNGAGKTTTIRLLLGLIRPSAGGASVLGREVAGGSADWRADVGYLPGELSLWPSLSGRETLTFLGDLTRRPSTMRDELCARLQLSASDLARPVRTYSDGMKQKLGLVQALQCAPRLVLLDEPTKSLDPLIQEACYELLRECAARGTTVFFSSHVLPEVELLCDRVAMLRGGRLVSLGTLDELRGTVPRRVVITFREDVGADRVADLGRVIVATARRVELMVNADRITDVVGRLAALPLADVVIEPPSLEALFMERYR